VDRAGVVFCTLVVWSGLLAVAVAEPPAEPEREQQASPSQAAPPTPAATEQLQPSDAQVAPPAVPPAPVAQPEAAATAASKPAQTLEASPVAAPASTTPDTGQAQNQDGSSVLGDPWGDDHGGLTEGMLSFRVLLQTRYAVSTIEKSTNMRPGFALRENLLAREGDGFELNRFFLRAGADPSETLRFRAILDFAQLSGNVKGTIKQVYMTLRPLPGHFEVSAGIFKLPFSILELDPIAEYELSDVGAADDLVKDLGFGGRDVGVELMLAPFAKPRLLRVALGVFRGQAHDEHAWPFGALGARVESKPLKWLRLGADFVAQPFSLTYSRPFDTSNKDVLPMPESALFPRAEHWAAGRAASADVTLRRWHFMLRGEAMLGDRVDVDMRYGARTFLAAWALLAYRFRLGPTHLMPALRVEWLDADREHAVGVRRSISAGVNCFFSKQVRLLIDITRTDVEAGSPLLAQPLPIPGFPYFELNRTRVVAQLQGKI
jgi:hypothetical protein